ncbi:hypothetical protein ACFFTU_27140 [Streptomyces cremeus]|uniref:Uncharacterized protein n=1 Tax=Streptomyces cremeus TaxID=66881 RepID=A0ABV5PLI7_STRCM
MGIGTTRRLLEHAQFFAAPVEVGDQTPPLLHKFIAALGQGLALLLELALPVLAPRGQWGCRAAELFQVQAQLGLAGTDLGQFLHDPAQCFLAVQETEQEGVLVAAAGGGSDVHQGLAVGGEQFGAAL